MTLEYGKCASCGRENPKAIQQCRGCNAVLPWVKGAAPQAAPLNGGSSADVNSNVKPKVGLGDVAWGGMAVALGGGAIFVLGAFLWCGNVFRFFPTFPFAGYITMAIGGAIWRFGSSME